MRIKYLKYMLFFISLIACDAYADSGALDLCMEKQAYLFKDLNLPVEPPKYDNLGQCVESFVEENRAEYHLKNSEDINTCGFICNKKRDFLRSFYGYKGYANLVKDSLDEKDQIAITDHLGSSITNYVKGQLLKPVKNRRYGFPFLKKIIIDFSEVLIEIQLKRINFETQKIDQVELTEIMLSEIKDCLKGATTEQGIKLCVGVFKRNTTYKLGALIQNELLMLHFADRIAKAEFSDFLKVAKDSYNFCALSYFYSPNEPQVKISEKILPCIYSSIFESFLRVAKKIIKEKSDLTEKEISSVVTGLVAKCSEKKIIQNTGVARYKILQSYDEEDFTDYLLNCQENLVNGAVGEIGEQTIANHPAVVDIIGKNKASAFAKSVVKENLPVCINRLGVTSSPELCKNYLFAKTVAKIFPIVLDEKFSAYKSRYPFLTDELILASKNKAESSLDTCHREAYKDFKAYSKTEAFEAEVSTAKCLRASILESLDGIVKIYIDNELSSNTTLVENDISFGFKRKTEIKNNFLSCSALSIRVKNGLQSVLESSSTFLDTCVLSNTKDVVDKVFRDLVIENLLSIGLSGKQSKNIYASYRENKEGLLYKVKNVKTLKELEGVLSNAKNKVINDLSDDVIRLLILKESPIKFNKKDMKKLIARGKSSLSTCLLSSDVKTCADQAKDAVILLAVELFLPAAVEDEFISKLSSYIPRAEIRGLGIKQKIISSFGEKPAEHKIVKWIASEIKKKSPLDKIKNDTRLIRYVLSTAFFPEADKIIEKIILKVSPVQFSRVNLKSLVLIGKGSLKECLRNKPIEACSSAAEIAVMRRAVQMYFPQAVNSEVAEALKKWVPREKVNSFGIAEAIKKDVESPDFGKSVVDVVVSEIQKGRSVESIKKNKTVTGFIADVLSKTTLPDAYGVNRGVLDEISILVIQKEIDDFIQSAKLGNEGFFLNLGVKVRFSGRNKEALRWLKSRRTESGKLATAEFKRILKDVIRTSREITLADKARVEKHVTDAVLSYYKLRFGLKTKAKRDKGSKSKKKKSVRTNLSEERPSDKTRVRAKPIKKRELKAIKLNRKKTNSKRKAHRQTER